MHRESNHVEQALTYGAGGGREIDRCKADWMALDYHGFINHLSNRWMQQQTGSLLIHGVSASRLRHQVSIDLIDVTATQRGFPEPALRYY